MQKINSYKPKLSTECFNSKDVLVIFGEVFSRGYINGIIDEAKKLNMNIIYSTVGRRDENQNLRPLNEKELLEKKTAGQFPIINIPLEAGFDMEPDDQGIRPVDQLKGVKFKEWEKVKLDWSSIESSKQKAISRFKTNLNLYISELKKIIPEGANVVFAHTMAGGVPRTKIVMPLMNRVFKGHGDRFMESKLFWSSEIGQLCSQNFDEVTANTFQYLVDATQDIRTNVQSSEKKVSYLAFGYHGTELLINGEYKWQSYSPYLQGFAKIKLEDIAKNYWNQDIHTMVFNAPEILTNSSSIFLGIEVALYPLLGALQKENENSKYIKQILERSNQLLKPEFKLENILELTDEYFSSSTIKNEWSKFEDWPQHNGPDQMELMRRTSQKIIEMHKDEKNLLTQELSELVFKACGRVMIHEAFTPTSPIWWVGHDAVAQLADTLE